jgi:hypothetical protein
VDGNLGFGQPLLLGAGLGFGTFFFESLMHGGHSIEDKKRHYANDFTRGAARLRTTERGKLPG